IVRDGEGPAVRELPRLDGAVKGVRAARGHSDGHPLVFTGGADEVDEVGAKGVANDHLSPLVLKPHDLVGGHYWKNSAEGTLALEPQEDAVLVLQAGIAESDADQETVELGFGERKGALEFDRVLRGENQEGFWEHGRVAVDGDLVFFHRFEESRLRAGRGPVDLVGQ